MILKILFLSASIAFEIHLFFGSCNINVLYAWNILYTNITNCLIKIIEYYFWNLLSLHFVRWCYYHCSMLFIKEDKDLTANSIDCLRSPIKLYMQRKEERFKSNEI